MRAVVVEQFGIPGRLSVIEAADPAPGPGQVLVAVEAIGVGGVDAFIRSGAVMQHGFLPGHVLGGEVAGTVAAVGEGASHTWVGRRVWAFLGVGGGYADLATAAVTDLVPLPQDLSAVDAVTVGGSSVVAHFALRAAQLRSGESVLVRGAAGGLGVMAVQLAARAQASIVAVTTSSAQRGDRLRGLGATHILDRLGDGPGAPDAFDVIVDVIAGSDLGRWLDRLRPNGRLMLIGALGGPPPERLTSEIFDRFQLSLSFATFSANTVPVAARNAAVAATFDDTVIGAVSSVVQAELPLADAARAHELLDGGHVFGRLVLVP